MSRTVVSLAAALVAAFMIAPVALAADLEIGGKAPDFKAKGVDGKEYSLASIKGAKVTVVTFTCNHCPVAVAYEDRFIDFQKKYAGKEVKFIAINVNASEDLAAMKQRVEEKGINYAYAYDETGDSARSFGAKVTPHVFVLDSEGVLAYQGAFDDKQNSPTTPHVENAVNSLLSGKKPEVQTTKPFGCGVRPRKN